MRPFFEENGFSEKDGTFENETRAFRVEYDEPRQMYLLMGAEKADGVIGEFSELSAWLFDDTQNAKDAGSVGIDFTNTMRDRTGLKPKSVARGKIDLPTAEKGTAMTASGFTKKVLDVFPQYKDAYKAHIEKYGNFLYLNFFSETLVPQIRDILTANEKKQVKKLFELLEAGYTQGDRETVNAVVASVAAAVYDDPALQANAEVMLENDKHFRGCVTAFIPVLAHNNKVRTALKH